MNASRMTLAACVVAMGALATGCDTMSDMGKRMRGDSSSASSGANSQADTYWSRNARDGYMTRESSMNYKGSDGRTMDFSQADADRDGRISEREWRAYNARR